MKDYIASALQGDRDAFSLLYISYAQSALRVSMAITKNPSLAADAVQEAFIRAYRKGHQRLDDKDFEPWFYRIVINESKRILKKRYDYAELTHEIPVPDKTRDSDLSISIAAAIDKLPVKFREVLSLKYLLDYTDTDIAKTLKKPVATIRSRIYYGKKALKELLTSEGGFHNE